MRPIYLSLFGFKLETYKRRLPRKIFLQAYLLLCVIYVSIINFITIGQKIKNVKTAGRIELETFEKEGHVSRSSSAGNVWKILIIVTKLNKVRSSY